MTLIARALNLWRRWREARAAAPFRWQRVEHFRAALAKADRETPAAPRTGRGVSTGSQRA